MDVEAFEAWMEKFGICQEGTMVTHSSGNGVSVISSSSIAHPSRGAYYPSHYTTGCLSETTKQLQQFPRLPFCRSAHARSPRASRGSPTATAQHWPSLSHFMANTLPDLFKSSLDAIGQGRSAEELGPELEGSARSSKRAQRYGKASTRKCFSVDSEGSTLPPVRTQIYHDCRATLKQPAFLRVHPSPCLLSDTIDAFESKYVPDFPKFSVPPPARFPSNTHTMSTSCITPYRAPASAPERDLLDVAAALDAADLAFLLEYCVRRRVEVDPAWVPDVTPELAEHTVGKGWIEQEPWLEATAAAGFVLSLPHSCPVCGDVTEHMAHRVTTDKRPAHWSTGHSSAPQDYGYLQGRRPSVPPYVRQAWSKGGGSLTTQDSAASTTHLFVDADRDPWVPQLRSRSVVVRSALIFVFLRV
ncbi:uncharacterized protein BXZ73DRAFT_79437 [Epithele typhae]|uniref:uncharacterized protein n=1 Tax=Epithele typhae TaxID=378194 RepID=UPI002008AB81|nr:uncharacterized protein BXZ73DRAFT_79437 [Epithele typhae]KAH9923750.1 hypothetical protein BXZ73DRAFT_79437 [Epithele typhae]